MGEKQEREAEGGSKREEKEESLEMGAWSVGAGGKGEAGRMEGYLGCLLQKAFGVPSASPPPRCSAHFCQGFSGTGTELFPRSPQPWQRQSVEKYPHESF